MSITIETLIFCDGGEGCPHKGQEATEGDSRASSAASYRHALKREGWVVARRGKDYCPKCAERLGFKSTSAQAGKGGA